MNIKKVGVSRPSFEKGRPQPVRMVVMHATAGTHPGDFNWLRRGGGVVDGKDRPVSVHYYIDKRGDITQMVEDADTAWHVGRSEWTVDGRRVDGCNPISIGIELENRNTGRDPYPQVQYDAALALTRDLVARYAIPRRQLARHLDISPGRKTDPAGFEWARFVNDVFDAGTMRADEQLRFLLIDLAYRAAGAGAPAGWPLLEQAVSRHTGMPVAVLSTPAPRAVSDDANTSARPLLLPNQPPLLVEAYGRDLLYAPAEQPQDIRLWSESPDGDLRRQLAEAMFREADPARGFHPEEAFHQAFLDDPKGVGVPIGPNHSPGQTSDGQRYACQHFALDSLCSPVGQWGTVIRLSELTRDMYGGDAHTSQEKELRALLLNDLYNARTGRNFAPDALFCKFALQQGLGAPLSPAEVLEVGGHKLVAMPFALDVLYCRVPEDGNWDDTTVGTLGNENDSGPARLTAVLGPETPDAATSAGPGVLGAEPDVDVLPGHTYRGGILGATTAQPYISDLTARGSVAGHDRGNERVELVVAYPTSGVASNEIAAAASPSAPATFHYYVAQDGAISRLVDEAYAARAAPGARWQGRAGVDSFSIAVAVEGAALAPMTAEGPQAKALSWLLHDVARRHGLRRRQVIQADDLDTRIGEVWENVLIGIGGEGEGGRDDD